MLMIRIYDIKGDPLFAVSSLYKEECHVIIYKKEASC
jgi:hypothetical protein